MKLLIQRVRGVFTQHFTDNVPFAFARLLIPGHKYIIRLDSNTFPGELLPELLQKFLQLGFIDDRDPIYDQSIVKSIVVLDLVPEMRIDP